MKTYRNLSIKELGIMIRGGEISCEELVGNIITDINNRNPWLNSFIRVTERRAIMEGRKADHELKNGLDRGPLHGIPYAIKDLFDVEGQPNSAGMPKFSRNLAKKDAAVVRYLSEAGAILVGQTQSSPLAATILGINHGYGTPRNPWKHDHYIPGGSSSGSAVAVSAGQVPFALGTDTGGSIRVPAALCGVVGFRPVPGDINLEGCWPLAPSLDSAGCLCRTVDDAAVIYSTLRGEPFKISDSVAGLKVALPENIFFEQARLDIREAVLEAAYALRALGVEIETVQFPELKFIQTLMNETSLIAAEAYGIHRMVIDDPQSDWVLHWVRKANGYTSSRLKEFRQYQQLLATELAKRTKTFDAILAPTVLIPAIAVKDCNEPEQHAAFSALLSKNTLTGNLAGWSGITVPCAILADGLPAGIMVFANSQKEQSAFALARSLEHLSPFKAFLSEPPFGFPFSATEK